MTLRRTIKWVSLLLLLALALQVPRWLAAWRAMQAYMYGYPLVTADVTRSVMTAPWPAGAKPRLGSGPINHFSHASVFPGADFRDVVAPNADTLYSIAWLDLSAEPMVLHTPEMSGRYLLMEILDGWSNAFGSLGTRAFGDHPRDYLVVGPGWKGTVPAGLQRVDCPTAIAWVIGRTVTRGVGDYDAVHAIQAQYTLMPLSRFLSHSPEAPVAAASAASAPDVDFKTPVVTQVARLDVATYFDRLARLMKDNPPAAIDAPMLKTLARFGVVPGQPFDAKAIDPSDLRALETGAWLAKGLFEAKAPNTQGELDESPTQRWLFQQAIAVVNHTVLNVHNGWNVLLNIGVYGNKYPLRAIVTLVGYGANTAKDAVYPMSSVDEHGDALDGAHAYVLHFDAKDLPPADAFWSLTMYDQAGFFVPNPLSRYALGDRDPLHFNPDGSLDLILARTAPGTSTANWLPAPVGPFKLMLRLYNPRASVLDGQWVPPAVRRLD